MFNSKWMQAVVAVLVLCSVQAYATETEKDLSQIKSQSQNNESDEKTTEKDILAGINLKAATDDGLSGEMKPEKPAFEKPAFEKPVFEKPKL